MKKNAAKIEIKVSVRGAICLELITDYNLTYTVNQYIVHIKNYISCFNKFAETNMLKPESTVFGEGKSCIAYLSYYSLTDLFSNTRGLYKMEDNDLKEYATALDRDQRTALDAPTIHMTLGNIFKEKDDEGNVKEPYKRFARFMDSSIWNFYAPIIIKDESIKDGSNSERYDFSYFIDAIHAIINNSFVVTKDGVNNLYEMNVTKEYADINERILMQSKLMGISGHGKNVSPFLFHSEQKVKEETKKKKELKRSGIKTLKDEILSYKWRILLVDDHAEIPMRKGEDSSTVAKLDIIEKGLTELFGVGTVTREVENSTAKIYIEYVSNIKEAEIVLKSKKYEIILLDYLLDQRQEGTGREYGYELLKEIYDKENGIKSDNSTDFDYKKGPDNRFYFMFISAFTTAVSERLLTEGWLRSEKYWYIGEGACPINTPYLFQYRLLHIMEKRMKDMNLQQFDVQSWLDKKIFSRTSPRKEARDHFKDALNFMCEYEQLEKDYSYDKNVFDSIESVMVTNFLGEKLYPKAVFEHVVQLVYLTAFGTVRQWPEMWEEYQFLKSVVGRIEVIEKYIFKLKNNNVE